MKENKQVKSNTITGGIILDDGNIKTFDEIQAKKKELKDIGDPNTDKIKDVSKTFSNVGGLMSPPYSMEILTKLPLINTIHNKCIQVKATDIVGRGWQIELIDGMAEDEVQKQWLHDFIENGAEPGRTFNKIMNNIVVDRLTTGNGAMELARDKAGEPALYAHMPFYTLRAHEDDKRWAHSVSNDIVWFKKFGIEEQFNKDDGREIDRFDSETSAHELLLLQNYTSLDSYYGIPEIISAVSAILGMKYERDYNLQFFENNAVPRYAIIVKGGVLDAELKRKIKEYFIREVKNNAHATLFLELPSDDGIGGKIEVDFKELDNTAKEGSFRLFRKDIIQEILVANGVPMEKLGMSESGRLGGNIGKELISNYVSSEVETVQNDVEDILYQVTKEKAPNYMVKWNDLDIEDEEKQMKILTQYVKDHVYTINEARAKLGLPGIGPSGDVIYIYTNAGAIEVGVVEQEKNNSLRTRRTKLDYELENMNDMLI
jgi:PBSX family phage portal protein